MNNRRRKTKDEEMERWRRTFHYVRIKICLLPDNEIKVSPDNKIKVKRFITFFASRAGAAASKN